MGTGQCDGKRYNRQAPTAYDKSDKRIEGYAKVVLHAHE